MNKTKKIWVENLSKGQKIEEHFVVTQMNLAKKKSGENYLRFTILDKSGNLEARVWDELMASRMENEIKDGQIVFIKGMVTEYGGLQVHVNDYVLSEQEQFSMEDFRPFTSKDINVMWNELLEYMKQVENEELRALLKNVFANNKEAFCQCVAGRRIHHNYGGGLLEHTLEVLDFCNTALAHQPKINKDILFTGALLHDIGKIFEYDFMKISCESTLRGKLLGGHIILGRDFIRESYPDNFPENFQIALEHLILSHHGIKEWGAVEEPKTMEAVVLHQADLMSARINQVALIVEAVDEGSWSNFDRFMGTELFYYGTGENVK